MSVQEELEKIAKQNGGLLNPEKVVAFARNKRTALHSRFTWDDGAAAHQYRLWQARQVIRVNAKVIEDTGEEMRVYVSLKADRGEGGYRRLVDVMSDEERRADLLIEAKAELAVFAEKYRHLNELAAVITEIDNVTGGKPKRKRRQRQPAMA